SPTSLKPVGQATPGAGAGAGAGGGGGAGAGAGGKAPSPGEATRSAPPPQALSASTAPMDINRFLVLLAAAMWNSPVVRWFGRNGRWTGRPIGPGNRHAALR